MRFLLRLTALAALMALGAGAPPLGAEPAASFENSLGMTFVLVPAGEFQMGSDREGALDTERPAHKVRITKPFYIATTEVTQGVYVRVTGVNPSRFKDWAAPADRVSWTDAFEFAAMLNQLEDTDGYKLPTEAQWEFAARGGTAGERFFDDVAEMGEYAWFRGNAAHTTHPAGRKKPSPFGLFDIYGNVWEWTEDWFNGGYYYSSPNDDPPGPRSGLDKVLRGGAWHNSAEAITSTRREPLGPSLVYNAVGLRVVFEGDPAERGVLKGAGAGAEPRLDAASEAEALNAQPEIPAAASPAPKSPAAESPAPESPAPESRAAESPAP
jgi:formylglycine-generating enzyme required for sulfatase activity